jgi:hypothetical protein
VTALIVNVVGQPPSSPSTGRLTALEERRNVRRCRRTTAVRNVLGVTAPVELVIRPLASSARRGRQTTAAGDVLGITPLVEPVIVQSTSASSTRTGTGTGRDTALEERRNVRRDGRVVLEERGGV